VPEPKIVKNRRAFFSNAAVPAQEIDVAGAVQEVFHHGRPISGETCRQAVEYAAVNAVSAVVRLEQLCSSTTGEPDPWSS
jgi:hypothetical protein